MRDSLILLGILVIFIGFSVVMAGIILGLIDKQGGGDVKGGLVVFIGPIPVAFGTDKGSLIFLSALMLVLMVVAWFLFYRG